MLEPTTSQFNSNQSFYLNSMLSDVANDAGAGLEEFRFTSEG